MQSYGPHYEELYRQAREKGIIFVRYSPDKPPAVQEGVVTVYDELLGEDLYLPYDLLVLSTPLIPQSDAQALSKILKIPLDEHGFFLEAHVKLKPLDFATDGVYLCGSAHWPSTINESIAQAYGAASRAATILSRDTIKAEGIVASVNPDLCISCDNCEFVCEYGAIKAQGGAAEVNPVLCKGCGTCSVECPANAITMQHFTDDQISSMIRVALEPTSGSSEPPALAIFCNWCAYAGADLAGVSRFQYPPIVKIIRVMCTGRINEKHILLAFMLGAKGVLIGGCHPGDCHYISGNLKAEERVKRVKQWLKQAGLEPERLRLEWISAGEGRKIAEVMDEFSNQLKKLGPNPLLIEAE
jgi:heterodisulfide reductase subunit A